MNVTQADLVCVEPQADFYRLLKENIARMPAVTANRVVTYQAFVSRVSNEQYSVHAHHGTGYKVKNVGGCTPVPSLSLPDLMKTLGKDLTDVVLIKVDTDGFDYECLLGCGEILSELHPFLYWENALDEAGTDEAYLGFTELGSYLSHSGYQYFFVFDNFGNYLAEGDPRFYQDVNNYLNRLRLCRTHTTLYYVDVLACKKEDKAQVEAIIAGYNNLCERIGAVGTTDFCK